MKIILNDFVPNLGVPGDQVEVADGYARNYLIPKKLADEATAGAIKTYDNNLKQRARKLSRVLTEAEEKKNKLESLPTLVFTRKAGEEGKLFGSVTSGDIEDALKAKGFSVEKKQIELKQPIKSISETTVAVKLFTNVAAQVKVSVEAEVEEIAPQEEESATEEDAKLGEEQKEETQEEESQAGATL